MTVLIALAALALLMLAAYRGYSVILFAPIAALGAVLLTDPSAVAPHSPGYSWRKWSVSSSSTSRCSCWAPCSAS